MTILFPAQLDNIISPSPETPTNQQVTPHQVQHLDANTAIMALQAKLGIDFQQDVNSVDYKLRGKITLVPAPATLTAPGTVGSVAYDADFFYVCTATNVWKSTPLGDFDSVVDQVSLASAQAAAALLSETAAAAQAVSAEQWQSESEAHALVAESRSDDAATEAAYSAERAVAAATQATAAQIQADSADSSANSALYHAETAVQSRDDAVLYRDAAQASATAAANSEQLAFQWKIESESLASYSADSATQAQTAAQTVTDALDLIQSVDTTTATTTVVLTQISAVYQFINPNGTNRDVTLPTLTAGDSGRAFCIKNTGTDGKFLNVRFNGLLVGFAVGNTFQLTAIWSGAGWEAI